MKWCRIIFKIVSNKIKKITKLGHKPFIRIMGVKIVVVNVERPFCFKKLSNTFQMILYIKFWYKNYDHQNKITTI